MATKRKGVSGGKNGRKKRKVEDEDDWYDGISSKGDITEEIIAQIYHLNDVCQKSMQ